MKKIILNVKSICFMPKNSVNEIKDNLDNSTV